MNATPEPQSIDYHSPDHWDRVVDSSRDLDFSHGAMLVRTVLEAVDTLPGARLLDVATGEGRLAIEASARGARAVGIDISPAAVSRAEALSLARSANNAPTFLNLDARSVPLPSETFDAATCLRSLWVLADLPRCLLELNRLLVPGGQIVIQLWGPPRSCRMIALGAAILGKRIPSLRCPEGATGTFDFTPERLAQTLGAAGFVLESTTWHTVDVRSASPELYWQQFGSVAGTAYAALREQTAAVRDQIDAELLARSRTLRDSEGGVVLPLTWAICSGRKQVSAAPTSS